jgi:hypothetical protein
VANGIELLERQRQAAESLRAYDGPELLAAVERLARTLQDTAADEELWSDLVEGAASDPERERMIGLLLVDWEPLLAESGVPEGDRLADEITDAIAGGAAEPEAWRAVQDQLRMLAGLLLEDVAAPAPVEDRGWWRRLRGRAAHGVSVLRRVSIGKILTEVAKGAVVATGSHLVVSLIFGAPFGPVGPIVAAALGALGKASYEELRRCMDEDAREREGEGLDDLFDDQAMQPGGLAFCRKYLDTILDLAAAGELLSADGVRGKIAHGGQGGDGTFVLTAVAELRRWGAHVGARIAAAWPLIAGLAGDAATRSAGAVIERLADFRRAVITLAEAIASGEVALVTAAVRVTRDAFESTEALLRELLGDIGDAGFGPAAHGHP